MTDPLICCICPAHARMDFVERTIRCFKAQTYENSWLRIVDTSPETLEWGDTLQYRIQYIVAQMLSGMTVGKIRNWAIASIVDKAPCIAHFDYDDWSAPERLQYQLDFMRSTGVAVVGFNDMAFYDAVRDRVLYYNSRMTNYGLGTSLFYKREAWERVKFPDITPEDTTWQHQVGHDNIRGCSSIVDGKPMMIQVLHGGNAAANASGAIFEPASADLDRQVREILKNA